MIVPESDGTEFLLRRLARHRLVARGVLLFEKIWPAIWPALGVAGLFLCAALLDLPRRLPPWGHAGLLVVTALAVIGLLLRGLARLRPPDVRAADRRLEQASGLRHRPLAVLTDRPASGTEGSEALWRAHVARAAAQVGKLRVGLPRPGLAARDPRALRAAVVVGLIACLGIAGEQAPGRIARAFHPLFTPPAQPAPAQVQAWITPPAYTGLAPLFLKPDVPAISAPAGSHLTINVTGGNVTGGDAASPSVSLAGRSVPPSALDRASFQAETDLTNGGRLAVSQGGRPLAGWEVTVVADQPPTASFPEDPGRARDGRVPLTRLPWQASDDYGVVALQAELRLRDRPQAPPLIVAIPLPSGSVKSAKGARLLDLTPHPWAGLPVTARLVARDAAGQTGASADAVFDMPERRFQNPVARALMAVRKMLSLKPDDREPAIRELLRLAGLDAVWQADAGGYLVLSDTASLLYRDRSPPAVDQAQEQLWALALHLEEGAPERTARALDQARQDLRELLDKERNGETVDKAELDRKAREVQEALQRHLQALAEQAARDPASQQADPESRALDARDLQRLAEQMREAARQGRMDEAREKLAEMERMLQDLQNAERQNGRMTQRQRERAEKRQRGQQQMSALQDMVRHEGALLDNAQNRGAPQMPDRPRFSPPRPGGDSQTNPSGPGEQPQSAQRQRDQAVQQALRRALGELMQRYGDLTGEIPPNLGEADAAMREGAQALSSGADPQAAAAAQRAIEALQKGGRAMSQQMAQQFGRGGQQGDDDGDDGDDGDGNGDMMGMGQDGMQPGDGNGPWGPGDPRGRADRRDGRSWDGRNRSVDRRADERRDPLGRPLKEGSSGMDESSDVVVPDQMEEARTRAIQEELRRRGADRNRAQSELDYIERLLRQF